jgi:N-acetylmuramoyl-L-alanine amidase
MAPARAAWAATDAADTRVEREIAMSMTTRKLFHPALWAAAAGLLALLGGCQPHQIQAQWPAPNEKLALHELADRLGLAIVHTSYSTATLRNCDHTLVLYSDPEGQAFVNGQPLPNSGGIKAEDGTLMVPANLAARIRSELFADRGPAIAGAPERPGLPDVPETPAPPDRPRPPPPIGKLGVVVIDAGHGGKDPGTTSVLGAREKDIVLSVARQVAAELRQCGVDARLTRSGDTFLELEDRPAVADRCKAQLFVSVHADASDNHAAQGFAVYVSPSASTHAQSAAKAVLKRLCDSCNPSRGLKTAKYKVLVHANVPAMLIELGFLSNRSEATALATATYQQRIARAIAHGCVDYLARR